MTRRTRRWLGTAVLLGACVGILAGAGLLVLLVLRRYGPIARWEVEAVERLMPHRRLLRARVLVVGRPS